MTNGMALAKPTPDDVRRMADEVLLLMSGREINNHTLREAISMGMMMERRRCRNIVDAEAEWGGDIREAERKINDGEGPRRIPGYNTPMEGVDPA